MESPPALLASQTHGNDIRGALQNKRGDVFAQLVNAYCDLICNLDVAIRSMESEGGFGVPNIPLLPHHVAGIDEIVPATRINQPVVDFLDNGCSSLVWGSTG